MYVVLTKLYYITKQQYCIITTIAKQKFRFTNLHKHGLYNKNKLIKSKYQIRRNNEVESI